MTRAGGQTRSGGRTRGGGRTRAGGRTRGVGRTRPALAALAAVLVLAGCATVPDSGPVRQVEAVGAPAGEDSVIEQPEVLLLPPEPVPGLAPEEVLRGFLAASAASDDDHAVARQYLTPAAREVWDDDGEVVVYDPVQLRVSCLSGSGERADCTDPQLMLVTGQKEAVIAEDGAWSVDQGALLDVYGIERVDGEWRLSQVPPGLRLTRVDITRAYRAVSVGFLDLYGEHVVRDRLFLPVVSRTLPQLLVEALLRGPTSRLAPAVTTAVPDGTRLRALTLEGGVVQVDLSAEAATATGEARRALSAQVVTTLRQVPDVTGVRLLVEGEPLEVPGAESRQPVDGWPQYEPLGLRLRGPGFVVAEGAVRPLTPGTPPSLGAPLAPVLEQPAVDPQRQRLAGLRTVAGGVELWSGPSSELALRVTAPRLAPPSWGGGRYGMWTARSAAEPEVLLVRDEGEPVVVPAPDLARVGEIREVRVSADDTRVAVVAGSGPDVRLYVGLVVPDATSAAGVALTRLQAVAPGLADVQDLSWGDDQRVTVLARSEGGLAAWAVQVDGSVVTPLATSGLEVAPTALASAPGQPLLLASGGRVWQVVDGVARQPVTGTDPFYPG